MFKYIFATLVLAGLIVGGFQNCSDSEFSSNQGARINPPVVDIPPAAVQSFNVGNFPEGDTCVEAGERKVFMIEVIDGDNEHKIAWKKTDSEEILSSSDSFAFTASPETVGFYEVIVDDGIKNVVYKFSVSYCDEPEPPVQPVDPPQPPIEPVEPPKPVKPPVEEPPPVKPPTEPISCIPPEIKTGQDLSQVLFVGEKFWLGYDVTGDPTPNIKWFFYKVPGDEPKRIYPPQFDHYFDIDPASFEDAGYYYITADNGCGDPVESSHFHVTVKGRVNGGSTVVAEAGEVTGWVEELSINSEGKLYAKGFACAKNHNKPIMVKIVAQKGSDPMQILGKNPTNRAVDKFQTCGNGGDGLHGFVWTSSRPAADFKGSRISVIGVHPSGRGALDREIPGKAITIE